jgi:aspartokinase/homoserine dehydrogenase 1
VLSGTIEFILSEMHNGSSFSTAVGVAVQRGYTETDPREVCAGTGTGGDIGIAKI